MTDSTPAPQEPSSGPSGAQDALELQVQSLFAEALGAPDIDIDVPFLDLGGHSLAALLLQERIQEATGRALDLDALFPFGTVRDVARELRGAPRSGADRRIVKLSGAADRRLYCVHSVVGTALRYQRLAGLLQEAGIQACAYQAPGLLSGDQPFDDVAEMASAYVAELRRQENSSVNLLGYSMGALVAYEMAEILEESGITVGQLFLVDTYAPTERHAWSRLSPELPPVLHLTSSLFGGWDDADFEDRSEEEAYGRLYEKAGREGRIPDGYTLADLRRLGTVVEAHSTAVAKYSPLPRPLRAEVTLFRTEPQPGVPDDMWWSRTLERPLSVVEVPGPHHRLLDSPTADLIAAEVARRLR